MRERMLVIARGGDMDVLSLGLRFRPLHSAATARRPFHVLGTAARPRRPSVSCWTGNSAPSYQISRHISASSKSSKPTLTLNNTSLPHAPPPPTSTNPSSPVPTITPPPLSLLPLPTLLRTYLITTVSSSPTLLTLTSTLLQRMLHSKSALFNIDRNPVLRWLLKKTFYAQFCAGENKTEVEVFLRDIEEVGYTGVCLEYAMEVLEGEGGDQNTSAANSEQEAIERWTTGVLDTIALARPGSFIAFKYSGMGPSAFHLLTCSSTPTAPIARALHAICSAAADRDIRLLPAAEPQNAQAAVDAWTLDLAREWNKGERALVYHTYQCYLKHTPRIIARHLQLAEKEGWRLGAKLVRGAYLETEARGLIWSEKEGTDKCYDGCMEALMRGEYNAVLQPAPTTTASSAEKEMKMPKVDVFLATHNKESVETAMRIREGLLQQKASTSDKAELGDLSYAQLLGMADEVSCSLLLAQTSSSSSPSTSTSLSTSTTSTHTPSNARSTSSGNVVQEPKIYKYATWGTLPQCLNYLLRRAAENRDAMGRTRESRRAVGREVLRRMGLTR